MGAVFGIIILIIWVYLSHKVGKKAENNGRNYFLWFIIGIIIDPILAFVILLMIGT